MDGYGPVGDIGQYEAPRCMAYVRGPEGNIVSLAERNPLTHPHPKTVQPRGTSDL